jgi:hypothetical protein
VAILTTLFGSQRAFGGTLSGPARFCGYSPIIDLEPSEQIETLEGGIHGGSFRWTGNFGSLDVAGIGWASKPPGRTAQQRTSKGLFRFQQLRRNGKYAVAIWNGRQGAAYFSSPRPLTKLQLAAIDRVDLYQEGEEPQGCKLRTIFSWE